MRDAFGRIFDVPDGYLNTASVGVPPRETADAVDRALDAWRHGTGRATDFDGVVARARAAFGRLVGVGADRVAVAGSVSPLVGLVAAATPDGARVLVAEGEFSSVSYPFAVQGRGITVTEVPLEELGERAPEADVVAVSVVQSLDGRLADLDALRAARASGTRVLLDVTQAAGWTPLDLGWADAVAGACYKWLLAPRGAAWMAVHPDLELVPHAANWYAAEDPWGSTTGLPPKLAAEARGLDTSPAWYCHVGAADSLAWLAGLDLTAVLAHCAGLADRFRAGLGLPPAGSAIVHVSVPDAARRLADAGIGATARGGGARLSFGLYSTDDDVARALAALT
ncbi:aminotransferase class V-fold PLP-dependent enzyme [Pseudonocardia halophobica]|uniref:Aminotransferase class V n=1 Tax=Pseudonocardia halophobica TaxID=29401 RepID=A0A9W6L4L1_9PSEU|nr:aminotransferase class V [Pseudonocardia halophobica]GLL13562.1 aminotransferase class V [Pseudonocardia halophobica]